MNKELEDLLEKYWETDMSAEELAKKAYDRGNKSSYKKYTVVKCTRNYYVKLIDSCSAVNSFYFGPADAYTEEQAKKAAQYCCDLLNGAI